MDPCLLLLCDADRALLPMEVEWSWPLLLFLLERDEDFFSLLPSRDLERDLEPDLERDLELRFLRRLSDRDLALVEEDLVLCMFADTPDLVDIPGDLDCPSEEEVPVSE